MGRGPISPETAEQIHLWSRVMGTGLGVGALAGAGQLGVGYGLGLVRLAQDFPNDGGWSAQVTWVAWFAAVAVLAGAAGGVWAARRNGLRLETRARVAVCVVAGIGAAVVVPLAALPADSATVVGRGDPALAAAVAAGLGVLVGVVTAATALTVRLVAVSVTLLMAVVWLVALVSVLGWLIPSGDLPEVRLAVLDLPAVGGGNQSTVAVAGVPLLALLICGAVAGAARSRGLAPLPTAVASTAAPGFLALIYLIGSPGTGDRAVQTAPYAASLIGVAVGLLASLVVGVARMPARRAAELEEPSPPLPSEPPGSTPPAEPGATEEFGRLAEFYRSGELDRPGEPGPAWDLDRDRNLERDLDQDRDLDRERDLDQERDLDRERDLDLEREPAEPAPPREEPAAPRIAPPEWARFDQPSETEPPVDSPVSVPPAWPASPPLPESDPDAALDPFQRLDPPPPRSFPEQVTPPAPPPFQEPVTTPPAPPPFEPVTPPEPTRQATAAQAAEAEAEAEAEATEAQATEAQATESAESMPGRRLRLPRLGRKPKRPTEQAPPSEDAAATSPPPEATGLAEVPESEAVPETPVEEPTAPAVPPKPVRRDEEEHLDWISSLAGGAEEEDDEPDTGRRRLRWNRDLGISADDLPEPPVRRQP